MDLKALNPNGNAFLVSFTKAKKTYKKFISHLLFLFYLKEKF